MKSIYVGNMPYKATEQELKELFSPFGEVIEVKIIIDRETQKPKGFCFVKMQDEDAQKAIEALNNTSFMGRNLKINEARSKN